MMVDQKEPSGANSVGYGRPPKEHQFKPGQSGNVGGRKKSKKSGATDISEILNAPVRVTIGGKVREMDSFEAGLRKIAKRALDGHLPSNLKFIKICEEDGALPPPPAATAGGAILPPDAMGLEDGFEGATAEGPASRLRRQLSGHQDGGECLAAVRPDSRPGPPLCDP